jgi:hypothetical protein
VSAKSRTAVVRKRTAKMADRTGDLHLAAPQTLETDFESPLRGSPVNVVESEVLVSELDAHR